MFLLLSNHLYIFHLSIKIPIFKYISLIEVWHQSMLPGVAIDTTIIVSLSTVARQFLNARAHFFSNYYGINKV